MKIKWQAVICTVMVSVLTTTGLAAPMTNTVINAIESPAPTSSEAPKASETPTNRGEKPTDTGTKATDKTKQPINITTEPQSKQAEPQTKPTELQSKPAKTEDKSIEPINKPTQPAPGANSNDVKKPIKGDKEKKLKDTKSNIYVCEPFVLDHFGVIKDSLATFNVNGKKLASYIRDGKKLEEVLEIEKIPVKKFKKEVIKQYNERVKAGVKDGKITKEQAKKLRGAIRQTINKWLQ